MDLEGGTSRDNGWWAERRTLFAIAAAVWISCAVVQLMQSWVLARAAGRAWAFGPAALGGFPWWFSWLLLTPLIAFLAERFPFNGGRHWRSLGRHALAGVAIAIVQLVAVGAMFWYTNGQYGGVATSLSNQVQRFFGSFFLESLITYAGTAGVWTAIDFARAVRDETVARARLEARAASLESSVTRARLDALAMQMNPHFLFNTLTAISGLVAQERRAEAREVIQRLGELLRQTIGSGGEPFHSVAREVELLEDYLYIQRTRFSDRLSARVDVEPAARDCPIPSMLLQPLVENAIRHGVEPDEGRGTVTVSISHSGTRLQVSIADSGNGFGGNGDGSRAREGIGIANTRERLEHIYGREATLTLGAARGGGAEVTLSLPVTTTMQPERR